MDSMALSPPLLELESLVEAWVVEVCDTSHCRMRTLQRVEHGPTHTGRCHRNTFASNIAPATGYRCIEIAPRRREAERQKTSNSSSKRRRVAKQRRSSIKCA